MWGRPRRATLPNGETCWVLVLDTEGLGGLEADAAYDLRIFSLATLLCSTLVYNSLGTIDENAISSLSFVAQLTQHIRIHPAHTDGTDDEEEEDDGELEAMEFHNFFPTFAWVLRDFALDLVDERGIPMSADEYLESALRPQVGFDENIMERNRIRQMLTAFFTDRKCFPLVRPLVDEAKLQEIDKVPYNDLRQDFRDGMEELKDFLYLHHLRPKIVHNVALNGSSFIGLCEQYITAITSGGVPTISSAWQEVMQQECQEASEKALMVYDHTIKKQMENSSASLELHALVNIHARALKAAIQTFTSRAGGEEKDIYQERLESDLLERFSDLATDNMRKSEEQCGQAISSLYSSLIEPKLSDGKGGYLQAMDGPYVALQADLNILGNNYKASRSVAGPAKGAVLATFYDVQVLEAVRWLSLKLEEEHEKKMDEIHEKMNNVKVKLASVEAREKVYNESIEKQREEALAMQTKALKLEGERSATEGRVNQLIGELQQRNEKIKELELELEESKEAFESEHHWQSTLTEKIDRLQQAHDDKHKQLASLQAEHSTHQQSHAEKHETLERRIGEMEADLERSQTQRETALEQLRGKISELEDKENHLSEVQREKLQLSRDLESARNQHEQEKKKSEKHVTDGQKMEKKLAADIAQTRDAADKEK